VLNHKKAKASTYKCCAQNKYFSSPRHKWHIKIGRKIIVTTNIGEDCQCTTNSITGIIAKPIKPSVKLTEFEPPTIANQPISKKPIAFKGMIRSLKKGISSSAPIVLEFKLKTKNRLIECQLFELKVFVFCLVHQSFVF